MSRAHRLDHRLDSQQQAMMARAAAGMAHVRQLANMSPDRQRNLQGIARARAVLRHVVENPRHLRAVDGRAPRNEYRRRAET